MSTCKVLLSIPSDDLLPSVESVAEQLSSKYGVADVTIRSARAPLDRLLANLSESPAVFVFYKGYASSVAQLLEEESPYPLLEVDEASKPADIAWNVAKVCSLESAAVRTQVHKAAKERRQSKLVVDAQLQTKSLKYQKAIATSFDGKLQITGEKTGLESKRGKVRDRVEIDGKSLALITTDRQSGFDRQLALVPYKGAVLNLTSAFWFEQTKTIIPNHILSIPHPYVTIAKKCEPFPIEFVVR